MSPGCRQPDHRHQLRRDLARPAIPIHFVKERTVTNAAGILLRRRQQRRACRIHQPQLIRIEPCRSCSCMLLSGARPRPACACHRARSGRRRRNLPGHPDRHEEGPARTPQRPRPARRTAAQLLPRDLSIIPARVMSNSSAVSTPSCRRRSASTTHMRYPPSSGNLPILPNTLSIHPRPYPVMTAARVCVKDMSAACLGGVAGVKSRSPPLRVREAQDLRPAPSPKHNGACRSAAVGPMPAFDLPIVIQVHVPALASCGVVPHQLISGRRSQQPHHEPPYLGHWAGQSGPFFSFGMFQPVVDTVPCPGLRRADQARPNLVVSVTACGDVLHHLLIPPRHRLAHPAGVKLSRPSARRLRAPRRRSRSATAPRAACGPAPQWRCAYRACFGP